MSEGEDLGEVLVDTEGLARALHHAMAWQYDECDHGKYVGGPNDGQPYAMCEIFARRMVWLLRDENADKKTKLKLIEKLDLNLAEHRARFWEEAHKMHRVMRMLVAQCPYCVGRQEPKSEEPTDIDLTEAHRMHRAIRTLVPMEEMKISLDTNDPVVTVNGEVYDECPRCGNHGPHPAEQERKRTRDGKLYRLTCASCGLSFVQDSMAGQDEALAAIIDSTTAIETAAKAIATATEAISLSLIKHDPTARECIRLGVPTEDLHDGPCPACRVLRGLIATSELAELIEDEPPLPEETQE